MLRGCDLLRWNTRRWYVLWLLLEEMNLCRFVFSTEEMVNYILICSLMPSHSPWKKWPVTLDGTAGKCSPAAWQLSGLTGGWGLPWEAPVTRALRFPPCLVGGAGGPLGTKCGIFPNVTNYWWHHRKGPVLSLHFQGQLQVCWHRSWSLLDTWADPGWWWRWGQKHCPRPRRHCASSVYASEPPFATAARPRSSSPRMEAEPLAARQRHLPGQPYGSHAAGLVWSPRCVPPFPEGSHREPPAEPPPPQRRPPPSQAAPRPFPPRTSRPPLVTSLAPSPPSLSPPAPAKSRASSPPRGRCSRDRQRPAGGLGGHARGGPAGGVGGGVGRRRGSRCARAPWQAGGGSGGGRVCPSAPRAGGGGDGGGGAAPALRDSRRPWPAARRGGPSRAAAAAEEKPPRWGRADPGGTKRRRRRRRGGSPGGRWPPPARRSGEPPCWGAAAGRSRRTPGPRGRWRG